MYISIAKGIIMSISRQECCDVVIIMYNADSKKERNHRIKEDLACAENK